MPSRQGIDLSTTLWNTSMQDFDRLFPELEAAAMNETDARFDSLFTRYTALPADLPDTVRLKAEEITRNDETPYAKVLSLVNWLDENMQYSLEPERVPEGVDFVEYFLQTGVGYCTYYATALTVMARSVSIPSRYVIGFALIEQDPGRRYIATGETAHAWTEMYFHGIGWVEIDPLRWNPAAPLNQIIIDDSEFEPPPDTQPENEGEPEIPDEEPEPEIDIQEEEDGSGSFLVFIIIPVVLVLLVVFFRISVNKLMTRKEKQFAFDRIYDGKKDDFHYLEVYYSDILKQLALIGLSPDPGETLITFPERVDKRIRNTKGEFSRIADSIADYHFAGIDPGMKQVEDAYKYHASLEKLLIEWLGKWMYLFKRAIR